jgi:hypothetical protein
MHYSLLSYIAYPSIYTYKIGLNMGKPMGQHPNPITLSQNPKVGRDLVISASFCAPPSTGFRSLKIGQHDQETPKTWLRANMPPTLTCDLSRLTSHSGLISLDSNASSLARAASTCFFVVASCSVNSYITTSFTGPCRRCSVVVTTCYNSAPWLSTSINN